MVTVDSVLSIARSELGRHEDPIGSNVTRYGQALGLTPAAWCMQLVTWCLDQAGFPLPADARSRSSCGFFLQLARNAGWIVDEPTPGCVELFAWTQAGLTWPDHAGLVEAVHPGATTTIEGNAGGPDGYDEVARHVRPRDATVVAFVRPPYEPAPAVVMPMPQSEPRVLQPPHPWIPNGVLLTVGGGHHDQVATYQTRMVQRGWRIVVDGLFGPQTLAVTKQFQAEKRLTVDGVVGPQTWNGAFELPVT